ncbi:MAG: phosphoribosyl-AMP cyclohydrolase [Actinobacteria bacterium]|jgi:phosphoribosyl-AMP cyclohydrolase|nr:phosphoribosyl-AMP cyclohydrolase [Actinomycetota bacterium]MDA2984695.1 phosphoribosyl-AMP cyclohydrolase [Actinomycetota bacterium]
MIQNPDLINRIVELFPDENLLLPCIAQDIESKDVLMLAYVNRAALLTTLESGKATYFSRSRSELWEKGASSGHTQRVRSITFDCDGDAILYQVEQVGAACHTGEPTCFFEKIF